MAQKTYVPTLRLVLYGTHKYMTRWQSRLHEFLTEAQYTCLLSVIQAVADCLALLGQPTPDE